MTENILTQSTLKQLLHYNAETGVFTWLVKKSNNLNIGDIAGCLQKNINGKQYRVIKINNIKHKSHRLAWLYVHGKFPAEQIDHIDGNGLNNSLKNLRSVTRKVNCKNLRLPSTNTSGIIGIYWNIDLNKWHSRITVDYKRIHLGYFIQINDAIIARKMAETKYGFHKNHGTDRPL